MSELKAHYRIVTTFNVGIQGGNQLSVSNRNAISGDLFLYDGKELLKNNLICLQEIGVSIPNTKNYQTLRNKPRTDNKKAKQLRIIYQDTEFKCIEQVSSDIRSQIVLFKDLYDETYFIIINCHIGQVGKVGSEYELFILNEFINKVSKLGIPIIVVGDFNREQAKINQHILKFANLSSEITTTGGNVYDHIMYSDLNFKNINCQVHKNFSTPNKEAQINHYGLRAKFSVQRVLKKITYTTQSIYDSCKTVKYESFPITIGKSDITNTINYLLPPKSTSTKVTNTNRTPLATPLTISFPTNPYLISQNATPKSFITVTNTTRAPLETPPPISLPTNPYLISQNATPKSFTTVTNTTRAPLETPLPISFPTNPYLISQNATPKSFTTVTNTNKTPFPTTSHTVSYTTSKTPTYKANIEKSLRDVLEEIWIRTTSSKKLNVSGLYRELNTSQFCYDTLNNYIKGKSTNLNCKKAIDEYLKKNSAIKIT